MISSQVLNDPPEGVFFAESPGFGYHAKSFEGAIG
jgi:hypothetical protein